MHLGEPGYSARLVGLPDIEVLVRFARLSGLKGLRPGLPVTHSELVNPHSQHQLFCLSSSGSTGIA